MIPGSQALLLMVFGRGKQATALAIWSMTTLVAPIMGPILGGYISTEFTWPWIFLINLPVGVICALICWTNLRQRETPTRKLPVDAIGFSMLVVWVGALQVMLDTGKDADWFSSPVIVIEGLVALTGFVAWMIWELNEKHPIVDLSLFRKRNFALGVIALSLGFAVFFGNNLLMPLWLQTQMAYTATWAGLVAAPAGLIAVIMTPFVARLKIDARWTATVALGAFALSFYMRSNYAPDADFYELVIPTLVMGFGMSGFFISMVTIALNGVPPQQVPQATGLSNFARITAGSFAASITTTIWDRSEALHQTRLAETTGSPGNPLWGTALHDLQSHGASASQALAAMMNQVLHQAYFLATMDLFRVSAWITLALIPIVWLTTKALNQGGHAAGGE